MNAHKRLLTLTAQSIVRRNRKQPQRLFHNQQYLNHTKHQSSKPRVLQQHKFSLLRWSLGSVVGAFVLYDGIANEFTYCGAGVRFLRSLKTATLIAIDYLRLNEKDPNYDALLKMTHQRSADRLLETCLLNGGLYIKVGQGVSAINHILPKEYTSTLAKLQDKCLPSSRRDVENVFLKDFGRKPEEIYAEFDYTPIAAASIAQVFKAKLKNGQDVAVKVQYGDLQKRFVSDLGTIIFLQDIIELFFKNYNFGWILVDVRKNLIQELNFINEAKNAERCARDLEKFSFVHVPKIDWEHTKTRVLTLEWIDGFKVSDIAQIQQSGLDLKDIDRKLFKIFAEQIFNSGFVHADPHAGNIFIRRNEQTGQSDIILLDHGLYEELSEDIRLPLREFWEATVLRDEKRMNMVAQKLAIKDHMKFAEVLFQQPISLHGGRITTKLNADDIEYMQQLAKKNFDLIMNTLKEMPRNMLFVVRNLNTVRAISRLHGDVVDRPRVMAQYAQRCIYENYNSLLGYIRWFCRRAHFEYCLWMFSFRRACLYFYINLLYRLGRAPAPANVIMTELETPELN